MPLTVESAEISRGLDDLQSPSKSLLRPLTYLAVLAPVGPNLLHPRQPITDLLKQELRSIPISDVLRREPLAIRGYVLHLRLDPVFYGI